MKNRYIKELKVRYIASDATLNSLLDDIDIQALELEADSEFEFRVIDPPIVNKVDLRKHPHDAIREEYIKIFKAGGVVVGAYDKSGKLQFVVPKPKAREIGKTIEDFEPIRIKHRQRLTTKKISKLIDTHFEYATPRGKKRLKVMTPDDFWANLHPDLLERIFASEDPEVQEVIEYINGLEFVELQDKEVKRNIKVLRKKKLIQGRLFLEAEVS